MQFFGVTPFLSCCAAPPLCIYARYLLTWMLQRTDTNIIQSHSCAAPEFYSSTLDIETAAVSLQPVSHSKHDPLRLGVSSSQQMGPTLPLTLCEGCANGSVCLNITLNGTHCPSRLEESRAWTHRREVTPN